MPALLTRISRRPNRATASLTASCDLPGARHIHLQRQRPAAERFDLLNQTSVAACVAQPQRDIRARVRQGEGDRPPEPARGARHQGNLAGEIKSREIVHDD